MADAATDSDFSDGASVCDRYWEVIDYLSLEAASMKTLRINISDQAGTPGDVGTPSKDKSMEHINKIVAKRIEFTEPYNHVHKEIHVLYQHLRDLKVGQAVMHPMQYRIRRRVLRVDRNECRKEMRLIGDIVAWMQRLKIALQREVAVASESMEVRMEAQEAREHIQAEGRESRVR